MGSFSLVDTLLAKLANNFDIPQCDNSPVNKCKVNKADDMSIRNFKNNGILSGEFVEDDEELSFGPHAMHQEIVTYNSQTSPYYCHVDERKDLSEMYDNWNETNALKNIQPSVPRVFLAPVAKPQDLHYIVPEKHDGAVYVAGPHGPIMVEVAKDAMPGEQRTWRLGPNGTKVIIPEGLSAGDFMRFDIDNVSREVVIPEGKVAGDTFEVVPPAVVLMVPEGVVQGDYLEFIGPAGENLTVQVPDGMQAGQYFSLML